MVVPPVIWHMANLTYPQSLLKAFVFSGGHLTEANLPTAQVVPGLAGHIVLHQAIITGLPGDSTTKVGFI